MKIFYLALHLIIFSCGSVKLDTQKEYEEIFGNLKGKISQIEIYTKYYPTEENDTIIQRENHKYFFNKNKLSKEINNYLNFNDSDTTTYFYNHKLLDNEIRKTKNIISKRKYFYNNKKNLINKKIINNGELGIEIKYLYDKKNNLIEVESNEIKHNTKTVEKYVNDYKSKTVEIITLKNGNEKSNILLKKHFNKKGILIKSEFLYTDEPKKKYSWYTLIDYDKYGNITCRKSFHYDGNQYGKTCYVYNYDKIGNIIFSKTFFNDKLFEESNYNIIYDD